MTNDQTAVAPDEFETSLKDKKVLIIGSGEDLDSRRLQKEIDESDRWDLIVRINKMYGRPECVGTRTDVIITRWAQWVGHDSKFFDKGTLDRAQRIIILNQSIGYSERERLLIASEIGHPHVSAGPQAIAYFINRGCEHIDLIGFGYLNGEFMKEKRYADNSRNYPTRMKDNNDLYDWSKERQWMLNQPEVNFI